MIEATEDEVREYIRKRVGNNVRGAAREYEVPYSYLRTVLSGEYPPGPSVMRGFGVVRETKYYIPEDD